MRTVVVILLIVLLAAVGFGIWRYTNRTVITASQFKGRVTSVEGPVLQVIGVYAVENPPAGYVPPELEVRVLTDPATQIVVTLYTRPTPEQLAASTGQFNLSDLEQRQVQGRVSELLNRPVTITAAGDIFGRTQFTAQKIETFSMTSPGQ